MEDEDCDIFGLGSQPRASLVPKSQSQRNCNTDLDVNYFEEIISKGGFVFTDGDQPNILKCDQNIFRKSITKSLSFNPKLNKKESVKQFLKYFDDHIQDLTNLKWALLYTESDIDCGSFRGGQQDSLIRILLNVEQLQPRLVSLLSEKLLEIAHEDSENTKQDSGCVDVARLILANLRWLDCVVEPKALLSTITDLLDGSPVQIQAEVIPFAADILSDEHHSEVAQVLRSLYDSTPDLTPVIVDALSCLSVGEDALADIHGSLLKTVRSVKPQHLPLVLKFLLHNTSAADAYQVMSDLRQRLLLPGDRPRSTQDRSRSQSKSPSSDVDDVCALEVMLFADVRTAFLTCKHLVPAWIKCLNEVADSSSDNDNVTPLDLSFVLVAHSTFPALRARITPLLERLARRGKFVPDVEGFLSTYFKAHIAVIREYFESVKSIGAKVIRHLDQAVSNLGIAFYKYSFIYLSSYEQQEVVVALLAHLGDAASARSSALRLLSELAKEHTTLLAKFTLFLQGMVDMLECLSVGESKILLDAFLRLAHRAPGGGDPALRDQMAVAARKQIAHPNIKLQRVGVLIAVLTMKHSQATDGGAADEERSMPSSSTSRGRSRSSTVSEEALSLFRLVLESRRRSPLAVALFFDELATCILTHGLDPAVEELISNDMMNEFENAFVVDCVEADKKRSDSLSAESQWNLDDETDSEKERAIAIAIADMVVAQTKQPSDQHKMSLTLLCSHFRLIRTVESHLRAGSLSAVDALLGCGVRMPRVCLYARDSSFEALTPRDQESVLHSLFFAVNWLREVVAAFVTQKDTAMRAKVIIRLRKLICLERHLARLLPLSPAGYSPPKALFDVDPFVPVCNTLKSSSNATAKKKSTKKGKKRKKAGDDENEEGEEVAATMPSQRKATQGINATQSPDGFVSEMRGFGAFLRELSLDVFNLLFKNLNFNLEIESDDTKGLSVCEALFLLSDLSRKLSRVFDSASNAKVPFGLKANNSNKEAGFAQLDAFSAVDVASRAMRFCTPIGSHVRSIVSFVQRFRDDSGSADGDDDPCLAMGLRRAPILRLFTHLLIALRLMLSWTRLREDTHVAMLNTILSSICGSGKGEVVSVCQAMTASRQWCGAASDLGVAAGAELIRLMDALSKHRTAENQLREHIVSVGDKFLRQSWYAASGAEDKGAAYNEHLRAVLTLTLRHCPDRVSLVRTIALDSVQPLGDEKASRGLEHDYVTITKATLPTTYSVLMENLVSGTSRRSQSASVADVSTESRLAAWDNAVSALSAMVMPLKTMGAPPRLVATCLKYAEQFIRLFVRVAMPLLDSCLRSHAAQVTALLKSLQVITRFLQHLCTHVKSERDLNVAKFVPGMKRSLEAVVFRVKAMLAVNECSDAFWMGNLKNRDLRGHEILSQTAQEEEQSNDEDNCRGSDNESSISTGSQHSQSATF